MVLNDFQTYVKAVGTGPKGNRDLSFDESKDMMQQILNQGVHPERIAAFLLGWRLKPETIEEFKGTLLALEQHLLRKKIDDSVELGYPFDGKLKTPYLFPLIAQELHNSKLNLIVVGDKLQPAKNGITTQDICSKLSLHANTHYFDRKEYSPELHALTDIRQRLALRTGLNTLEKLPNIAESDFAITGVHHTPYVKKYQDIFASKYLRFALIQGSEGGPELFSKGKLWISEGGKTSEELIVPARYGIHYEKSSQTLTHEEMLHILENPDDTLMQLAKLNAAILLFLSNQAKSIDEAYESLV